MQFSMLYLANCILCDVDRVERHGACDFIFVKNVR